MHEAHVRPASSEYWHLDCPAVIVSLSRHNDLLVDVVFTCSRRCFVLIFWGQRAWKRLLLVALFTPRCYANRLLRFASSSALDLWRLIRGCPGATAATDRRSIPTTYVQCNLDATRRTARHRVVPVLRFRSVDLQWKNWREKLLIVIDSSVSSLLELSVAQLIHIYLVLKDSWPLAWRPGLTVLAVTVVQVYSAETASINSD